MQNLFYLENLQTNLQQTTKYQVLLYYKYVNLTNLQEIYNKQKEICEKLNLKGRIILAEEGINGTVEGEVSNLQTYIEETKKIPEFADIYFKATDSNGSAFPKMSIKIRKEIVTLNLNIDPRKITGKYISAEELHSCLRKGDNLYIVDMRNNYEVKAGKFDGSVVFEDMFNFRDLPKVIKQIEPLKKEKIVTVCTGGIRCEKASAFLLANGFENVYQLKDGILEYMKKYPNQDFQGKLYTFDARILIGFQTDSLEHKILGKCDLCQAESENYVNYKHPENGKRVYGIVCSKCLSKNLVELE